MSKPRFADFRPETMLTAADFNVLEKSGQIKLVPCFVRGCSVSCRNMNFFAFWKNEERENHSKRLFATWKKGLNKQLKVSRP